ncbi:MAG: hypothetical protein IJG24_06465 [Selenomonadaceae bacterium]|nr:hypothetical protein [Selenomonadaceae bacterium]
MEEKDICAALLEAAELRKPENNRAQVKIVRNGKNLFEFTIEPLTEADWRKCRRQNLKNRGKSTEELDEARFLSQVIYEATIPEDKARLWQQKEVWQALNVISGVDVVDKVLTPGEKSRLGREIEKLSGYGEDGLDEQIKNLSETEAES